MGNDDNLFKIILNGVDRLDQPLPALHILGAKTLVDDQRLQPGAGSAGQDFADGDANGKVDPKSLAAGKELVVAGANFIGDTNIEGLNRTVAALGLALGLKADAGNAMIVTLIAFAAAFALGSWWLARTIQAEVEASAPKYLGREWWAICIPLIFMQGMQLILNRLNILMLGSLTGPEEAGIYAAATRISELAIFGLIIVNPIVAPMISELFHSARREELQQAVVLAARITTTITVLASALLVVFGNRV